MHRKELLADSGGAGRWRGGLGHADRVELPRRRLLGRLDDHRPARVRRPRASPAASPARSASTCSTRASTRRRRCSCRWPSTITSTCVCAGGAGYGEPLARPAEEVLRDVVLGFVTIEAAEREYARRDPLHRRAGPPRAAAGALRDRRRRDRPAARYLRSSTPPGRPRRRRRPCPGRGRARRRPGSRGSPPPGPPDRRSDRTGSRGCGCPRRSTKPSRAARASQPSAASARAQTASPNGITSTGTGACSPRCATRFDASPTTTNRSAAEATIFSRSSAPPSPFTRPRSGAISSAPSMADASCGCSASVVSGTPCSRASAGGGLRRRHRDDARAARPRRAAGRSRS